MTQLSDTQRILLSAASQRESGSFLPLHACLKASSGTTKAIDALVKRGLAEERATTDQAAVHRADADVRYGLFVTAAGLSAIGVDTACDAGAGAAGSEAIAPAPADARINKTAVVLDLLRRPDGATLAELIEATGWLPHTTRAALTGIRKKGHGIERNKCDGATCYRIVVTG